MEGPKKLTDEEREEKNWKIKVDRQNQELKRKELELKLTLVRKEIETVEEPNWWQKEYEGYDLSLKGKDNFAEVEEFLQSLPENDKKEIVFKAKRGMRYKELLNWLRDEKGTAHKYGADKIEKTMEYFSSWQDLRTFLKKKEVELLEALE